MMTQSEVRTEVMAALRANTSITNIAKIAWLGELVKANFPKVVVSIIDSPGEYTFGIEEKAQEFVFQIDVYTDIGNVGIAHMDTLVEAIRTTMVQLNYRNVPSPPEALIEDIQKVFRALRWERFNV